jgi:uncharacterized protein YecE (DUF72 family)
LSEVTLGTSGWSYKEWEGVFYPEGLKSKLSFYAKYFKTVEIDSTFYAYPNQGMIWGCARSTPDDFSFSVKVPKLITHEKKLEAEKGVKPDLLRFLGLLKPLIDRKKLGPVLIQLAPSFSYDKHFKNLRGFLDVIPSDLMFAVEFRHKSWLRGETWDLLKKNNVANTIVDEPLLPPEPIVTADFSSIRWHGQGTRPWYNYRYDENELKPWVGKVKEVAEKTKKVYGYFNNHFRGFAIENGLEMMQLLNMMNPQQKALLEEVKERISSGITQKQRTLQE